jgi:hypothetical protein
MEDRYYHYEEVAPGLYLVSYLTMDAPDFFLIEITPEQEEAAMGNGVLLYTPDGNPALIVIVR